MASVEIKKSSVILKLTYPRSKIRICDENGNHIARPAKEGKYIETYYIEWMITNPQIKKLIRLFLSKKDRKKVASKLSKIRIFLKDSKYRIRKATKKELKPKFLKFKIYEYKEKFYSFERKIISGIKIRATFKMGDYTLAPHYFVLFPFENKKIKVYNKKGKIKINDFLGTCAYAIWKPAEKQIASIIEGLSYASKDHKNDLLDLL